MPRLEALDAGELKKRVGACRIGREIIVLEKTTSTNDVVRDLAAKGATEGLVVIAETQTSGRGQYGRRWESSSGLGLWFSILLQPKIAVADSPGLTSWLAQAIADVVEKEIGVAASVKPPNDIYVSGKKVAGVLVEMRAVTGGEHLAIAGAGVNVNHRREDFPAALQASATSLAIAAGRTINRSNLAVALLRALDRSYPSALKISQRI